MKSYGISGWIVSALTTDEAIEGIKCSDFNELELSGTGSGLLKAWEDGPVATCQKLSSVDIQVPSIHGPTAGRRLDHADEVARQASIAANFVYFDKMKSSGIPEIVIHPTGAGDFSTQEKSAESRARSVESLKSLAERAGQMGLRLAVENLGRGRPGSTLSDLLEMIEGTGDHVGICFDVGHAEQAGLDLIHELKTAASAGKLFSLHIHDVSDAGGDHFIPGEGRIDWDAFISELDACGFRGGRILEISPPEADVAERLCKLALLRDEWEGIERNHE